MINEEQIKRAKELMGLITPGNWTVEEDSKSVESSSTWHQVCSTDGWHTNEKDWFEIALEKQANAQAIALFRNMMPGLIEEREALKQVVTNMEKYRVIPSADLALENITLAAKYQMAEEELAQAQSEVERLGSSWGYLRQEVRDFATAMETKLRANNYKGGWSHMTTSELRERLLKEVTELKQAPFEEVLNEAADVANFAMMIADVRGALNPQPVCSRCGGSREYFHEESNRYWPCPDCAEVSNDPNYDRPSSCNVRVEDTGKCSICGYYTHDLDLSFECWLCYPICHLAMWQDLIDHEVSDDHT